LENKPQNTAQQQFATQPPANEVSAKRLQKHNGSILKKIVERFGQAASCVQTIVVSLLDKMNLSNKLANNKALP